MANGYQIDCLTCKARGSSVLCNCGDEALLAVSKHKTPRLLNKGGKLFTIGERKLGVNLIKKGFLKVELNPERGRPLILRIAGKGAIFGHRLSKNHQFYPYTALAISDVEYCHIPYDQFQEIANQNPVLRQQLINQFLDELELAERRALFLATRTVAEKVAEALMIIANAYEYHASANESFRIDMDRQDIADLAGTTKEQVSRVLKGFERKKLIRFSAKEFSYLNLPELRKISSL